MMPELDFGWDDDPTPPKKEPSKTAGYGKIMAAIEVLTRIQKKEDPDKTTKQLNNVETLLIEHQDVIDYDLVCTLTKDSDGEWEKGSQVLCFAYEAAKKNGHDMSQDQGAYLSLLAEQGKRYSIGHALKNDRWSKSKILEALKIAACGNKEGTTRCILQNYDQFTARELLTFHRENTNSYSYDIDNIITPRIRKLFKDEYPDLDALLEARNNMADDDAAKDYIQQHLKETVGDKWQQVSDFEIAYKSGAFDTNITRIFNFKANKVHVTTETRHTSDVKLMDFDEFNNKDEILEAHKTLCILSPTAVEAPNFIEPARRPPAQSGKPRIGG